MDVNVFETKNEMGQKAAQAGAAAIREALDKRGQASIIVATGASQFEVIEHLVAQPNIAWDKVTAFHLDEYVGLPITHDASFRLYLWKRFVSQLPLPLKAFHYLNGEDDAPGECTRVGTMLKEHTIDVAFVGIGENSHLAFNDPPADFDTQEPYLVVNLDEDCRRQQMGEGWFPTLDAVPTQAISMSVQQILKSRTIICTVPDERKANAVKLTVESDVSPQVPASILQTHKDCGLFLDRPAASLLSSQVQA